MLLEVRNVAKRYGIRPHCKTSLSILRQADCWLVSPMGGRDYHQSCALHDYEGGSWFVVISQEESETISFCPTYDPPAAYSRGAGVYSGWLDFQLKQTVH